MFGMAQQAPSRLLYYVTYVLRLQQLAASSSHRWGWHGCRSYRSSRWTSNSRHEDRGVPGSTRGLDQLGTDVPGHEPGVRAPFHTR